MTDDEYREFLGALARKHLRLHRIGMNHPAGAAALAYEIERLSKLARLVAVAAEDGDDRRLAEVVAERLRHARIDSVVRMLDDCGIMSAIDEDPVTLFRSLRTSVIPAEDRAFLADAGVRDPEAEITLLIHYARSNLAVPGRPDPSDAMTKAADELARAAHELEQAAVLIKSNDPGSEAKKKRKILNGIGKIVGGVIAGGGNALVGLGTIAAPNPATAYAVIASSGIAAASVCQGLGDLRGE